jgi:arylsulfatase
MRRRAAGDKPFFAFVPYTQTHLPVEPHPDQTDFFTGRTEGSNRESVVVYVGKELYGVKWRDWKMMVKEISTIAGDPVRSYGVPLFYNLLLDPKEEYPALNAPPNFWVRYPAGQVLVDHMVSLQREPPIRPGTPDPYVSVGN